MLCWSFIITLYKKYDWLIILLLIDIRIIFSSELLRTLPLGRVLLSVFRHTQMPLSCFSFFFFLLIRSIFPLAVYANPLYSTPSLAPGIVSLSNFSHYRRRAVALHWILSCIFLVTMSIFLFIYWPFGYPLMWTAYLGCFSTFLSRNFSYKFLKWKKFNFLKRILDMSPLLFRSDLHCHSLNGVFWMNTISYQLLL